MNTLKITAKVKASNKDRLEVIFQNICSALRISNVTLTICPASELSAYGVAEEGGKVAEVANRNNIIDVIAVMAHELRHCFQYQHKMLKGMVWLGKDYTGRSYNSQPWEHDALDYENKILAMYGR